jgi:predicted MFS family arabinose efflux permease
LVWGDPLVWGSVVVGIGALLGFLLRERRTRDPLLPLTLFRSRTFTVMNLVTFLLYGAMNAALVFIIIFVQQVAGYSPIGTGLAVIPITGLMFLLSTRFGVLSDWSTRRYSLRRGKEDVRALLGQHSAASRPDAPARSSYHRHAPA